MRGFGHCFGSGQCNCRDLVLVRVATGVTLPIVGRLVVSALTFSGAIAVLSLRNASARRILSGGIPALVTSVAITLAGVQMHYVSLMLAGTIVAGIGFGAAFSGLCEP